MGEEKELTFVDSDGGWRKRGAAEDDGGGDDEGPFWGLAFQNMYDNIHFAVWLVSYKLQKKKLEEETIKNRFSTHFFTNNS